MQATRLLLSIRVHYHMNSNRVSDTMLPPSPTLVGVMPWRTIEGKHRKITNNPDKILTTLPDALTNPASRCKHIRRLMSFCILIQLTVLDCGNGLSHEASSEETFVVHVRIEGGERGDMKKFFATLSRVSSRT